MKSRIRKRQDLEFGPNLDSSSIINTAEQLTDYVAIFGSQRQLNFSRGFTYKNSDLFWMICLIWLCKELIIPYLYSVCCSEGGKHAAPIPPPGPPPLPLHRWGRCYLSTDARHWSFGRLHREVDGGQTEGYGDQDKRAKRNAEQLFTNSLQNFMYIRVHWNYQSFFASGCIENPLAVYITSDLTRGRR